MAKAKKSRRRIRREKFNLGRKALTRALMAAQREAETAVRVGKKGVASAQGAGDAEVLKFNRENLAGARSAVRYFRGAVRQIANMDCTDQWMNCDPEFLFFRRGGR
jgi:hypothetical protein